jgi:hypothetical protein
MSYWTVAPWAAENGPTKTKPASCSFSNGMTVTRDASSRAEVPLTALSKEKEKNVKPPTWQAKSSSR